ncbi:MAG: hypothetical protein IKJ49_03250, partial [Bacteroidaceae bacterium]|nr:hypothetical protein [Bacteroidaceae bacterium]
VVFGHADSDMVLLEHGHIVIAAVLHSTVRVVYQSLQGYSTSLFDSHPFIFIYIFVSRSFPLPSAFLSTDIERGKVFGLNTLRRRKTQSETACRPDLSTFKG